MNVYTAFRLSLDNLSPQKQDACAVTVSAADLYLLYVNGRYLGRGPVRAWRKYIGIDSYPIGCYLKPGRNVISALVYHYGLDVGSQETRGPGFYFDGGLKGVSFATGVAPWQWARPACWAPDSSRISPYFGFNEDLRMEAYQPELWQNGADAVAWQPVEIISRADACRPQPEPRIIPLLAERDLGNFRVLASGAWAPGGRPAARMANAMAAEQHRQYCSAPGKQPTAAWPVHLEAGPPRYLILDAGRIISGVAAVEIETRCPGIELRIGYDQAVFRGGKQLGRVAEAIAPDPAANLDLALRADHGLPEENNQVDRLWLKPGRNIWSGHFNLRGFRFVKLCFSELREAVDIRAVRGREITYPVPDIAPPAKERPPLRSAKTAARSEPRGGFFRCSDPQLNAVWEAARLTTRLCMADTFLDNPSRERQQYGGDGYCEALLAHDFFGDTLLWRQFLRQFAQGARPDKAVQSGGPWPWNQVIYAWTLLWIESIGEYVRHTGDQSVGAEYARAITRALDWFVQFEDRRGVLKARERFNWQPPNPDVLWNFIDWQRNGGQLKGAAAEATLNCIYLQALRTAAELLRLADRKATAEKLAARHGRLKTALQAMFRDKAPGTESEHAVAYACISGITRAGMERLSRRAERGESDADILFLFFTLKALEIDGRPEAALKLIRAVFAPMLEQGEATFYETIDARLLPGRALCQGIGGLAGYFLPRIIAGIREIDARQKTARVAPALCGLEWVEAAVPCADGLIRVAVKTARGGQVRVTAPPGWRVKVRKQKFG